MPLNPTLDQPWFTPLADAIPLAGTTSGLIPGLKPPFASIGADHDWEVSLPQCVSSWQETQIDNILRSGMETGLSKQRRLWSKPVPLVQVSMPLKAAQYKTFWAFYNHVLKNGLETFMFRNPFDDTYKVYRFTSVPTMQAQTDKVLEVSMQWECVRGE